MLFVEKSRYWNDICVKILITIRCVMWPILFNVQRDYCQPAGNKERYKS
jgi:hypothetical protein